MTFNRSQQSGQAAIEFMGLLSMMIIMIVGITLLNLNFFHTSYETRNLMKKIHLSNTIANTINAVYIAGDGMEKTIDLRAIISVNNVNIRVDNQTVIAFTETASGTGMGAFRVMIPNVTRQTEFNSSKVKFVNQGGIIDIEIIE